MSSRRDATRYAAKRRAAARKRNREIGRYIFAYAIIGILAIGTISSVFIAQVNTGVVTPTPTPPVNTGLAQLVTQGDQAVATGVFTQAIGLYNAYLSQNPQDADVHFKLGKAYIDTRNPSPDYLAGLSHLQRAIEINSSGAFVTEAQQLIIQYADQANAAITQTAVSSVVTGTATITGTTAITGTVLPSSSSATGTVPSLNTSNVTPTAPVTATKAITP